MSALKQREVAALLDLYRSGRFDAAEETARRLIVEYPGDSVLPNLLGACLTAQNRHEEAVASYERSIALNPRHPGTYNNLGIALQKLGRLDEAIAQFRTAVEGKPDYVTALINLADTYLLEERLDEAAASYRRALELKPDHADAHNNLGSVLRKMGRVGEAVSSYQRALQIKPDHAAAHNNMGNVLTELGRTEEAAASYRQAIRVRPRDALAHYNLHALLLDRENMAPSLECLERAVQSRPEDLNLGLFLGMCLEYAGSAEAAKVHLHRVASGPDIVRARLDSWEYIKSAGDHVPTMIGSQIAAFRLGMAAAPGQGLVLEFGVRFGTSVRIIASLAGQPVHGFDSFEGLPEAWGEAPKGEYSTGGALPKVPGNVSLYAGWFDKTLPEFLETHREPVRFVNIDCDIYSSTKTVLELLGPQIGVGTVLVFDEYVGNLTWREDEFKAFQEAVARYGWTYEYLAFSMFTKQAVVRILSA